MWNKTLTWLTPSIHAPLLVSWACTLDGVGPQNNQQQREQTKLGIHNASLQYKNIRYAYNVTTDHWALFCNKRIPFLLWFDSLQPSPRNQGGEEEIEPGNEKYRVMSGYIITTW